MKKLFFIPILTVFFTTISWAQAPKYVLFEHFTNTRCGICGGTNPIFYQNININANAKLHHISMHSSIPYSACVFYQANTTPQDDRATFYNIPGTPRVAINGTSVVSAGGVSAATIDNLYCATCSPVELKVAEIDNGDGTRSAQMRIKSVGTPPSGNYRLYAAVVEKIVNYSAPNGETVHHNVFRQFLTPTTGQPQSLPAQGGGTSLVVYNYTLNANWVANQAYVVTWIANETTKEVLNSGTKFDANVIPVELSAWKGSVLGKKNRLEWTTATEINTQYFDIERSDDGKTFASIGRLKASGQSSTLVNYAFDDLNFEQNIHYYRLKTVDLDGSFTHSNSVTIARKDKKTPTLSLFPSPAQGALTVVFASDNTPSDWRILDALGKVVKQSSGAVKAQNTEGVQSDILDVSDLQNGVYFFQLIKANNSEIARFIKAN